MSLPERGQIWRTRGIITEEAVVLRIRENKITDRKSVEFVNVMDPNDQVLTRDLDGFLEDYEDTGKRPPEPAFSGREIWDPNALERIENLEEKLGIASMKSEEGDLEVKTMSQIHAAGIILLLLGVIFRDAAIGRGLILSGVLMLCFGFRVIWRFVRERARELIKARKAKEDDG